uniref:Uncharacterized protein n=1 Tax=Sphaerodactylus townsendi TaxID=933632 RepID=A0ACB8EM22_9SAUR
MEFSQGELRQYLRQVDATMSIIDVSMLTGYGPATEDLKKRAVVTAMGWGEGEAKLSRPLSKARELHSFLKIIETDTSQKSRNRSMNTSERGGTSSSIWTRTRFSHLEDECLEFKLYKLF